MTSVDPYFVPTRASASRAVSHEVVCFKKKENAKVKEEETKNMDEKTEIPDHNQEVFDMKKNRFEVFKFVQNSLHGQEKQQSQRELAIKLGAKPPKKGFKNYKVLKEDKRKEHEEALMKQELYNITMKKKVAQHTSKRNKSTLKNKRKIGSGILNVYGKAKAPKRYRK